MANGGGLVSVHHPQAGRIVIGRACSMSWASCPAPLGIAIVVSPSPCASPAMTRWMRGSVSAGTAVAPRSRNSMLVPRTWAISPARAHALEHGLDPCRIEIPHFAEYDPARDHVSCSRLRPDPTDGCNLAAGKLCRRSIHCQHQLGCRKQCIVALVHRGSARVVLRAPPRKLIIWAAARGRCKYRAGGVYRPDCPRCCWNCQTMPGVRYHRRTLTRSSRRSRCHYAHRGSWMSQR
jgi:hypothetical protein